VNELAEVFPVLGPEWLAEAETITHRLDGLRTREGPGEPLRRVPRKQTDQQEGDERDTECLKRDQREAPENVSRHEGGALELLSERLVGEVSNGGADVLDGRRRGYLDPRLCQEDPRHLVRDDLLCLIAQRFALTEILDVLHFR
jgi:hypothetical protein